MQDLQRSIHLALMAGLNSAVETYTPRDQVDQVNPVPSFICPIYAAYMGNGYRDDKAELGDLIRVTKKSPPTFMVVTGDDRMRGTQAALLFAKLREHGVPVELHAYAVSGQGYGIEQTEKPVAAWNIVVASCGKPMFRASLGALQSEVLRVFSGFS